MTKSLFKILIFIIFICLAIIYNQVFLGFFVIQFAGIKVYQVIWFLLILFLIKALLIVSKYNIADGKMYAKYYQPTKEVIDDLEIRKLVYESRIGIIKSLIFYFSVVGLFWISYFALDLNILWLYGMVIFLIVLDGIFMDYWCVFRNWLIKNKCCNNCRIFNWGYWMVFCPLIVAPNFWHYSLIVLSALILIQWEWAHYKYPERFYELTNLNLRCTNCKKATGFCKKNRT